MERVDVSIATLNALVRAEAHLLSACDRCVIGRVHIQSPDQLGCNWRVSLVQGEGAAACSLALLRGLVALRLQYHLVVATGLA